MSRLISLAESVQQNPSYEQKARVFWSACAFVAFKSISFSPRIGLVFTVVPLSCDFGVRKASIQLARERSLPRRDFQAVI